jgi:hypothetical protein
VIHDDGVWPTTGDAMATAVDIRRMGAWSEPEEHVIVVVHRSGVRTRWLRTLGGFYRKVSSEIALQPAVDE